MLPNKTENGSVSSHIQPSNPSTLWNDHSAQRKTNTQKIISWYFQASQQKFPNFNIIWWTLCTHSTQSSGISAENTYALGFSVLLDSREHSTLAAYNQLHVLGLNSKITKSFQETTKTICVTTQSHQLHLTWSAVWWSDATVSEAMSVCRGQQWAEASC